MTYHQFTEALEKSVKEMAGCLLSVELCNNKKNKYRRKICYIISRK